MNWKLLLIAAAILLLVAPVWTMRKKRYRLNLENLKRIAAERARESRGR